MESRPLSDLSRLNGNQQALQHGNHFFHFLRVSVIGIQNIRRQLKASPISLGSDVFLPLRFDVCKLVGLGL
jgi:hypothetical protein